MFVCARIVSALGCMHHSHAASAERTDASRYHPPASPPLCALLLALSHVCACVCVCVCARMCVCACVCTCVCAPVCFPAQATWLKSVAVVVSVGGVVMMSVAPQHSDSKEHPMPMGYLWLMVSVLAYACFEVRRPCFALP